MRTLILSTLSTLALLIYPLSLSAQNSFSISLEVHGAAGDQGVTPDFNGDGVVNFADFLAFAGQFGSRQGDGRYDAKYDLDSDRAIGFGDFLIFSSNFGKEVSTPGGSTTPVTIPDTNLRAAIEAALDKAMGVPITQADMASLTRLDAPGKNIRDLTGLAFAINLTRLYLDENQISDVSALSGLNNLKSLQLGYNIISDISALSNLPNLTDLYLSRNTISDLSPLVANTGLGSGDEVDVRNNPLSATSLNTHIPILQGRGVNVQFGASKPTIEKIEPGSRFKQGIMPR